jgi:hypothetical protein
VSGSDEVNDEADMPRGPDGEELTRQRRLTYRQARPWLKRSNVRIGVAPCGSSVRWVQEEERQTYVQQLRQAEGRDCNVAGDVLLYRNLEGASALVVEEPY